MNESQDEFQAEAGRHWLAALAAVTGIKCPVSATWQGAHEIRSVLTPFLGRAGHVHLPGGGGMDFMAIEDAAEDGCLSLLSGSTLAYVLKPRSLTLEAFPEAPRQSFLLLDLEDLPAHGFDRGRPGVTEEAVELPNGRYLDREFWERGSLGRDGQGQDIPLPPRSRPVVRLLAGKLLFVVKRGIWNSDRLTYDGRHNMMSPAEIRAAIAAHIPRTPHAGWF